MVLAASTATALPSNNEHPKTSPSDLRAPKYILTVLADDFGYHNIEFHNNNITSPHLSELAAAGVTMERHYVCVLACVHWLAAHH